MKLKKKTLHRIQFKILQNKNKHDKKLLQLKTCQYCAKQYRTTIHHTKYCCDKCRINANREKNNQRVRRYRQKYKQLQVGTGNISATAQKNHTYEKNIIRQEKRRLHLR